MKLMIIIYSILLAILISGEGQAATQANKSVKFKYAAADMTIEAEGIDIHDARSRASEECFDRRMDEYEARRGQMPSEEQSLMLIDSCVNI